MKKSMKIAGFLLLFLLFTTGISLPAAEKPAPESNLKPPEGYTLVYRQDFEKESSIGDFEFSDPKQWKLATVDGNTALEFFGKHRYKPKVRSPRIIGLIADKKFDDVIMEADLLQTGKEYGHRDMCLFFSFVDKTNYYYCHMAKKADPHAHNIFIVDDKPRTKIAKKTTGGIDWGTEQWHKIRLVRKASTGTIEIYYDDMSKPLMVAEDKTHGLGCIGFGSFDDSGKIDNIKVYAPKMVEVDTGFFKKKK